MNSVILQNMIAKVCCNCRKWMVFNPKEKIVCKYCDDYACSLCEINNTKDGNNILRCKNCDDMIIDKYPIKNKSDIV